MKIAAHIEKWERFDSVKSRFDPISEFELWYWSMLSAGMAMINAALHACRITTQNELFATQIPDVYVVIDTPDKWHHEIGIRSDLIHVGLPVINDEMPRLLLDAYDAMHEFESYRDPYVRGAEVITAEVVASCDNAYAAIISAARAAIDEANQ